MNDIAATMFNKKFLLEIFLKNQPIQSRSMLRAMFDKLAHASVMRLSTSSMDKVRHPMSFTGDVANHQPIGVPRVPTLKFTAVRSYDHGCQAPSADVQESSTACHGDS